MLFERQKRLLALLDALGGNISALDFQKLLFLYCSKSEEEPSYEFVPYRFGCFSFTSYADKHRLIERGLLADDERNWKLTDAGKKAATVTWVTRTTMKQFAQTHDSLRGNQLVAHTYRQSPYYAIRSEMAPRLLAKDPRALAAIEASRPPPARAGICTIGYEGRSLENYLNILIKQSITLLCDVRRNPLSRKYGFSKSTLSKSCGHIGIRYEHLPELGIAPEERRELNTQEDYDALFAVYERDSLPGQTGALRLIKSWVDEGHHVALTCFEHLPCQCHRHCVANALEKLFGPALEPRHL
ncbi:MAG: DUF488 domain-containing protein [Opitutaceae bacterium]|jgi:uncharacterized protein (DUF488 family)|nr:DUF488 domain-containing protein [Opitutaceae bacterium]